MTNRKDDVVPQAEPPVDVADQLNEWQDYMKFIRMIDGCYDMYNADGEWTDVTFVEIGNGASLHEKNGKWGCLIRSARGFPTSVVAPTYDEIHSLRFSTCVGRKGKDWYLIDGENDWDEVRVEDWDTLFNEVHCKNSRDGRGYEESQTRSVVLPDRPLMVLPYGKLILFQVEDRVCVADGANKYLTGKEVVPTYFLEPDGIVAISSSKLQYVVIGKEKARWVVLSDDGRMGDYDSDEQAFDAGVEQIAGRPQEEVEIVDELVRDLDAGDLKLWRIGTKWSIGGTAIEIRRPESEVPELRARLFAQRFVTPDLQSRESADRLETRFVGQTESGWVGVSERGRALGTYDSAESAWASLAAADAANEPEPVGVGNTDFPTCISTRNGDFEEEERTEAEREAGRFGGYDPDKTLRQDEAALEALGGCSEAGAFINLTPDAEYGCYLPVAWFTEFLQLKEGESSSKVGRAWFYEPPHDLEECIYRASVEGDILHVEVEVGPEALVRRAAFGLYAGERA